MKILHIIPAYFPAHRYGGPIESVHSLNVGLVKAGAEVTVYTTNIDGPNDLNAPTDVRVIKDGVKVFYFKSSFPRTWFYSRDLRKALAQNGRQFDLIHITSVFLSASTLGAYYAKKFKKPYIISPRGSLMKSPLFSENFLKKIKKRIYISLIENRNLKGASAVHFAVEAEKEEYLRAGLPLKKGIVIPNGLDLTEFQFYEVKPHKIDFREKFGIDSNRKIVLFLSRLTWIKGLDTLIPAFAEVVKKEPKAILVLAGPDDENYSKKIKEIISSFNNLISANQSNQHKSASFNIIFTGMLKGDDKIAAFQDSDVFVLPSYSESFGMAVIEAICFGLPVIITKNVGIAPDILKNKAGIIIDKDSEELASAILNLLENVNLGVKMGENGKELVKKEFSIDVVADKFLKLYNDIYGEGRIL